MFPNHFLSKYEEATPNQLLLLNLIHDPLQARKVYFTFKIETNAASPFPISKAQSVDIFEGGETWEEIRFKLEIQLKLTTIQQTNASWLTAYIQGFTFEEYQNKKGCVRDMVEPHPQRLFVSEQESDVPDTFKPIIAFVLVMRPLQQNVPLYIPPKFSRTVRLFFEKNNQPPSTQKLPQPIVYHPTSSTSPRKKSRSNTPVPVQTEHDEKIKEDDRKETEVEEVEEQKKVHEKSENVKFENVEPDHEQPDLEKEEEEMKKMRDVMEQEYSSMERNHELDMRRKMAREAANQRWLELQAVQAARIAQMELLKRRKVVNTPAVTGADYSQLSSSSSTLKLEQEQSPFDSSSRTYIFSRKHPSEFHRINSVETVNNRSSNYMFASKSNMTTSEATQNDTRENLTTISSSVFAGGETDTISSSKKYVFNNVPPPTYFCHACNRMGEHYRNECPSNYDLSYEVVKKRLLATGIPKMMLREPITEEEKETAMITMTGQLVVYKDKFKPEIKN